MRIGKHPLGIGVYLFDYRPEFQQQYGYGRQFGVMVDEVETVAPQAVSISSIGRKVVDYESLGIWQFDVGQPEKICGVPTTAESRSKSK
ncbi:hypothetical protein LG047_03750 [Methylocystis sp. WRRC1]|uniref:hypothetical protein n=1 Tax=Methylocystis sp. WRRC1 TaxID=1732014 RepID=UPI001D14060F|nr:hypothetical protein [Methylocystis sp. WRRC1]MCC3244444.1 hypothetical protein [Methylocystis sp. WRRC1]